MDKRFIALNFWVNQQLGQSGLELTPASSDASFRRYFRTEADGKSYIIMDAPPEKEGLGPFIHASELLHELGLHVPEVIAADPKQGLLLLTDLGQQTYLDSLDESTVERLYGDALGALLILQSGIHRDAHAFAPYSADLLGGEMALCLPWYFERHLGRTLTAETHSMLAEAYDRLVRSALSQPQVWVHRDYHSRNLMVCRRHNPGILDFQDAVTGPITYDLVSLLRDCYVRWPASRVDDWALGYQQQATESGLMREVEEQQFLDWFDLMGIQRHLKVLGIFCRLYYRDGKQDYLNNLPLVRSYLIAACGRQPKFNELAALLDATAS